MHVTLDMLQYLKMMLLSLVQDSEQWTVSVLYRLLIWAGEPSITVHTAAIQ